MTHKLFRLYGIIAILILGLIAVSALLTPYPSNAGSAAALTPPPTPLPNAEYYGILAHRQDCPDSNTGGLRIAGNSTNNIWGGSIQSAACLTASGSSVVNVLNGNIEYVTTYSPSGNPDVNPAPVQVPDAYPIVVENFVDCSGLPASSSDGNGTISPGIYDNILVDGNDNLIMSPGLYCLDGDFTINGTSSASVAGEGVTIYMRYGNMTANGNTPVNLMAPQTLPAGPNNGYLGLLIVMANENPGEIGLIGNSSSAYVGTIYAGHPDSQIELFSIISSVFETNLFAGHVKLVVGNSDIEIRFPKIYHLPLEKTAPETVAPGGLITYTLTVPNLHNFASVFDVVLTDTLPAGTTFITATLPFTRTGDTVTWTQDPLPHLTTWQVQMVVQVPLTTTLEAIVNETYGVTGEGAYPSTGAPLTTLLEYPPTATPTPTEPAPTSTPTALPPTPTPTLTPTAPPPIPFRVYLPLLRR